MVKSFKKIKLLCKKHNISLINIDVENLSKTLLLNWTDSINRLFEHLLFLNCKHLYIDIHEVNFNEIKSEFAIDDVSNKDYINKINEFLEKIKPFDKKIIRLLLLYPERSHLILFEEYSDDYNIYKNNYEKLKEIYEYYNKDYISNNLSINYEKRKSLMKPFAIELASHKDYPLIYYKPSELNILFDKVLGERPFNLKEIIDSKLKSDSFDVDIFNIALKNDILNTAKAYFNVHIKEKIQKENLEKVREWKKTKMTKVEMASRLGIKVSLLNEFFYKV